MFERFNNEGKKIIVLARKEAEKRHHDHLTPEHIALVISKEDSLGSTVVKGLGLPIEQTKWDIERTLLMGGTQKGLWRLFSRIPFSPRIQIINTYAVEEANFFGQNEIGSEHLLLGLLREEGGPSSTILKTLGANLSDARTIVGGFSRFHQMRVLEKIREGKTAWAAALSGLLFFLCGLGGSAVGQPIGECTACRPDRNSATGFSQRCREPGQARIVPCDPPEPTTGEPTLPTPGDLDRDRLVDSYEQYLLLKFAPKIWLHPNETRLPVNVRWLLARSTLRFSHALCSDHGLLAFGQVTVANLSRQTHRKANNPVKSAPWNACDHSGPTLRSDSYVSGPRTSFFLQFRDSAHNGSARKAEWELYGHVFPTKNKQIMIQYWQLYAFNDSAASANHEGDWEYTGVLINAAEVVQRVVHFRHGRIVESAPSRVEWDGTHHVTYVARGGHAQYRGFVRDENCVCEGPKDCAQGFADNCKPGIAWISWDPRFGGIVNVGEKYAPLNNSGWLRFSGIWGEVGAVPEVVRFTSGPQGPAFQDANWRWPD